MRLATIIRQLIVETRKPFIGKRVFHFSHGVLEESETKLDMCRERKLDKLRRLIIDDLPEAEVRQLTPYIGIARIEMPERIGYRLIPAIDASDRMLDKRSYLQYTACRPLFQESWVLPVEKRDILPD